ncbi:MAG: FlgO family outer membrane protein [Desulfobacterales bacterium]|jgi:TolB-like protein
MMKKNTGLVMILAFVVACSTAVKKNDAVKPAAAKDPQQTATAEQLRQDDAATVLVNTVVNHIHRLPNKRLTVADFTAIDGGESEIGKLIAEKITTKLSQIGELRVIERKQLNKILAEQKLSLSDITAEEEKEVGQILNVDAIISGTIAHLDEYVEINARMIDVTTGEIYCAINHKEKIDLQTQRLARLPESQQNRINQEVQRRETQRRQNPELFALRENLRKQLLVIKRRNPRRYDRVLRSIRNTERIKKENPRVFLLVTDPKNSPRLRKVRSRDPQLFRKVRKARRQVGFTVKQVPAYKEILRRERHEAALRIKAGKKQLQ